MARGPEAFVPGHVTGFFSTHPANDAVRAGSRGAGVALSDGVTVSASDGEQRSLTLNGETVSMAAVDGVLDRLGVDARIEAETSLPISAGFGVSGACALGTALTASAFTGTNRTERELVAIAHAAEVDAGTGLGDVVGQAYGGVPIRLEPGGPPHGTVDGLIERRRIEYVSFGELDTAEIITGDTDVLSRAGEQALERLRENPTIERFMDQSRQFAREAELLTAQIDSVIERVEDAGGTATMAMLGESVFALDDGLTAAGFDARHCSIATGAHRR
ncbi:pantoate kinase [Halocatena halophila]|uniref:pantoate kinase n=1 Tax=Halocatena halophila TaxID=2814576 RepID=UPI002ED198AD